MSASAVALTAEQSAKLAAVRVEIPHDAYAVASLTCDRSLLRYLRASEWHVLKAVNRLRDTFKWHAEERPHEIGRDEIADVLALGSLYRNGVDRHRRPIVYVKPAVRNPYRAERRVRTMIWTLEDTISSMDEVGRGAARWGWACYPE
jgi:phosphatidylinositol/phosphatidylcholine transfer protein